MQKLTIYHTNENKPDWKILRNDFYISDDFPTPPENGRGLTNGLCVIWREQMKDCCKVLGTSWCDVTATAPFGKDGSAFFSSCTGLYSQGKLPQTGEMLYRQVCRFPAFYPTGIPTQHWFRNFLDAGDLRETDDGSFTLRNAEFIARRFTNWVYSSNTPVLHNLVGVARSGQRPDLTRVREGAHFVYCAATDSHAQTRWRRRLQGKGVAAFEGAFYCLQALSAAFETAHDFLVYGIDFNPAVMWDALIAALAEVRRVYQEIKSYSEGEADETTGEQTEPILRFGPTWGDIVEAWQKADRAADKQVEELMNARKVPYEYAGDSYMTNSDLSDYNSLANLVIATVAFTLNADWLNPLAYKNQLSAAQRKRLPDVIELQF